MLIKYRLVISSLIALFALSACGDRAAREVLPTPLAKTCVNFPDMDNCDPDNDGLTNAQERDITGTDPRVYDTDGDGVKDGDDFDKGNNSTGLEACYPKQAAGYRGYDNKNPYWIKANCDLDDYTNGQEDNVSRRPKNYLSDPYSLQACFTFKGYTYCEIRFQVNGYERIWLDRNLGAKKVCSHPKDAECYGGLYQWGRRTDGHEKRDSRVTVQAFNTLNYTSKLFAKNTFFPNDWMFAAGEVSGSSGYVAERQALWQDPNDTTVCPFNWYVPTKKELEEVFTLKAIENGKDAFNSGLKLPYSGFRDTDGTLVGADSQGYLWTSDINIDPATFASYALGYTPVSQSIISKGKRVYGYSVRCIKAGIIPK